MSTPLPTNIADLPAHVGRPLSAAERAALPDLDWEEHEPPYLPKEYKVVFEHGRLTAPECGGDWLVSAEQKKTDHVEIKFSLRFPEEKEEFEKMMADMKTLESGSLEWFMSVNQRHHQELGRAGNQRWARLAIDALRRGGPVDDLDARALEAGFEYRFTTENGERSPVRFYHKDLAGGYFLQLVLGPTSASLGYEKDGSGSMDLVVSFYTNGQNQKGQWIPRLWPDVVANPATSIGLAVLEVSQAFEQEWALKHARKKAPKA